MFIRNIQILDDNNDEMSDHVRSEHTRLSKEMLRRYEEEAKDVLPREKLEEELRKLEADLEDSFEALQKRSEQKKYDQRMEVMQFANECVLFYEEEMQKKCTEYVEDEALNEFHESVEQQVLEKFNNRRSGLRMESEEATLDEIRQIISDMKARFEQENRRTSQGIANSVLDEFARLYKEFVEPDVSVKDVETKLKQQGDLFTELLAKMKDFAHEASPSVLDECLAQWQEERTIIDGAKMQKMAVEKRKQMCKCFAIEKEFREFVDNERKAIKDSYVPEASLELIFEKAKSKLLGEYAGRMRDGCTEEDIIGHSISRMMKYVETEYGHAKKQNAKMEESVSKGLEIAVIEAKFQYSEKMQKLLDGCYIIPDVLDEAHRKLLEEILEANFPREAETKVPLLKYHKLVMEISLEALYTEFKAWNDENRSFFRRVVGKAAGAMAALGIGGGITGGVFLAADIVGALATTAVVGATGVGAALIVGGVVCAGGVVIALSLRKKKIREYFVDKAEKFRGEISRRKDDIKKRKYKKNQ